ncbi:hypothetical protein H6F67_10455 [Microcoleus sp. FACHB-1515]|uniref:NotI family restriction endonuclease n=1 Tax=Cyanophyceae TaxID=3028117 RepID=UPI001689EFDE|nr:NotI family restriction endonuclease [Microcoleus sp. FACHB-1515]MBD2090273.1 hypothetical protein [Microcoleus sp. FACHB-1515]
MNKQPLAEVFGFPADSFTEEARRHRNNRLCPFNNKVPNCTKDSVVDPLGVCTIFDNDELAIICPVRFRQNWIIAEHAAAFCFSPGTRWTTLVEVRLNDKNGKSAGNIDVVLVAYDEEGKVTDFGSLEVQSVYISGNLRKSFFKPYADDPSGYLTTDWSRSRKKVPRPDYLSSSRKRLAPQLIYKGGIFKAWGRKQAVAVHSVFFDRLPSLPQVAKAEADIAWLIYDLVYDEQQQRYNLTPTRTIYTQFKPSLDRITLSEAGAVEDFIANLQLKLNAKLNGASTVEISDVPADLPADETDLFDELENI